MDKSPDASAASTASLPVLFVESYPHVVFGQQRTLLSILDLCARGNVAPTVASPAEGDFVDMVRARNIPVEVWPYPSMLARYGGAIYRDSGLRKVTSLWQAAGYVRQIRSRLELLRVAAVFCNDMRGLITVGLAARTLGVPVMIWDKLDRPHGGLDALQLPLATLNVIISDAVTAKYPRWQRRRFRNKIVRVPNGADLKLFDWARDVRDTLGFKKEDVIFAIIGAITHRKGHDRVLRVFDQLVQQVPGAKLVIVGGPATDEDRCYLEELQRLERRRVSWWGMRDDVPDILKSIDVVVVPSRHEGMGQITVEAMAAGKPVVGARAGGIAEVVVDGQTGLLFDGDDAGQLLDCLIRLGASAQLREHMGRAGRARAEACYDRSKQMATILRLLVEMIRSKRPKIEYQQS